MEPVSLILWLLSGVAVYALARAIARRIGRGMDELSNEPYNDDYGY